MYLGFKDSFNIGKVKCIDTDTKNIVDISTTSPQYKPFQPCFCGMYLQAIFDDVLKSWGFKNPRRVSKKTLYEKDLESKHLTLEYMFPKLAQSYSIIEYVTEKYTTYFVIVNLEPIYWFGVSVNQFGMIDVALNKPNSWDIAEPQVLNDDMKRDAKQLISYISSLANILT